MPEANTEKVIQTETPSMDWVLSGEVQEILGNLGYTLGKHQMTQLMPKVVDLMGDLDIYDAIKERVESEIERLQFKKDLTDDDVKIGCSYIVKNLDGLKRQYRRSIVTVVERIQHEGCSEFACETGKGRLMLFANELLRI